MCYCDLCTRKNVIFKWRNVLIFRKHLLCERWIFTRLTSMITIAGDLSHREPIKFVLKSHGVLKNSSDGRDHFWFWLFYLPIGLKRCRSGLQRGSPRPSPLLLLIYKNDLSAPITPRWYLFADVNFLHFMRCLGNRLTQIRQVTGYKVNDTRNSWASSRSTCQNCDCKAYKLTRIFAEHCLSAPSLHVF